MMQTEPNPREVTSTADDPNFSEQIKPLEEGINPSLRGCDSCKKFKVCKLYAKAIGQYKELKEDAESSGVTLDLLPPESIGSRCSEYESPVSR